ncbi:hypothetical protein HNP86_001888 [Methanococcus maripaludis]|uniref:Uncharacterized protein n=1 Tax=Methanococcus maripaludis TaxID=39152 RepID=A0A7J9NVM7_METMI|nr:hypothetical protein [Methanococcus maripaludis]MBA2851729.1 hypothetical protein [Methanococcus maripaludis]
MSLHDSVMFLVDAITNPYIKLEKLTAVKLVSLLFGSKVISADGKTFCAGTTCKYEIHVDASLDMTVEHQILHEILHIFFGHTGFTRCRLHEKCQCENLAMDIVVEKFIKEKFNFVTGNLDELREKFSDTYSLTFNETNGGLFDINCSYCVNTDNHDIDTNMNTVYTCPCTHVDTYIHETLIHVLTCVSEKRIHAAPHRNYLHNKDMYVPTCRSVPTTVHVIMDTSTSIPREIVHRIVETCTRFKQANMTIKLYGFSDTLYEWNGVLRYKNDTQFEQVYDKFKGTKNVVVISDFSFTQYQHELLDRSSFHTIEIPKVTEC